MPRICRTCDGSSVWRTSNAYNIYDSYMNHPQVVWGGYTIRCFFKIQVSFSVYRLFYRALLRGKPYNFERHTYNWAYVWKITHMSKLCHTSDWVTSQPSNNYVYIYIYIYIYVSIGILSHTLCRFRHRCISRACHCSGFRESCNMQGINALTHIYVYICTKLMCIQVYIHIYYVYIISKKICIHISPCHMKMSYK